MRLDEEEHAAGRQEGRWLDVKQAAEELGISSDAVRKRIARETLRSAKQEDGSVRVCLDSVDEQRDGDQPNSWTEAEHRLDDLIDAKDDALRDLRAQLEHMRHESERKDAIIMQMAQANAALAARVPELEATSEPRDASGTASPRSDRGMGPPGTLRSPHSGASEAGGVGGSASSECLICLLGNRVNKKRLAPSPKGVGQRSF